MRIARGVADEGDGSGRILDDSCDVLRQRCSAPRQEGFVPPHAGTMSAHQHESGVGHEKMVASHFEAN